MNNRAGTTSRFIRFVLGGGVPHAPRGRSHCRINFEVDYVQETFGVCVGSISRQKKLSFVLVQLINTHCAAVITGTPEAQHMFW